MADVTIKVRANGPYLIEGPVRIVDHLGRELVPPADKPLVALCRCGASRRRPFCDGSHKTCAFHVDEPAPG
ncbi:MAG: CDGSH iron-sulfur domain-containing protein [Pirellulales bacterium]